MKRFISIALSAMALSAAAQADVLYSFSGFDGGVNGGAINAVSFEYQAATFVSSSTPVLADQLSQCSTGPGMQCAQVTFFNDASSLAGVPGMQAISFGSWLPGGGMIQFYYYFPVPTLTTPGSYTASPISYPATLNISVVPEPSQALLLGLGLVPVLLRLRGKRAEPATA